MNKDEVIDFIDNSLTDKGVVVCKGLISKIALGLEFLAPLTLGQ